MAKKNLPQSAQDLKGRAAIFFDTIKLESDRGCVLIAAGFVDEALELLLRSYMTSEKSTVKRSVDPLFNPDGALGSLGAKSNLCRALKLLSDEEYNDLNGIRELRNYFAHSYVEASFGNLKAIDLVKNLNHFGTNGFPLNHEELKRPDHIRQRFSLCAAWIAGSLHKKAGWVGDEQKHDSDNLPSTLLKQS